MVERRAPTPTKEKLLQRDGAGEDTPPATWLAHVIQEQTCGDGNESLARGLHEDIVL